MSSQTEKKQVYVNTLNNSGFNGTLEVETNSYIELIINLDERDKGKRIRIYVSQIHFIRFDDEVAKKVTMMTTSKCHHQHTLAKALVC